MPTSEVCLTPRRSYRESHKFRGQDYQRTFTEYAYRALLWTWEREVLDAVVSPAASAHLVYLDFACGTGRVLRHLEERVKTATGVDVSASMLQVARNETVRANLI